MANIYEYDKIKFKYKLNYDGSVTDPGIYLCNRQLSKKGQLLYEDLLITVNFASANECSFKFCKYINSGINPYWDMLKDTSVILIEGFGYFEICVPGTETDTIVKNVQGWSLQESELGQCYCTLEINTENDILRENTDGGFSGYDENFPTLFYRTDGHKEASLLHRILTYAPHYSIGHVDNSLKSLNYIFSCENTSVLDFLNQISEEIKCIFIYDPYSRIINAFDLSEHCSKCGGRHIFAGRCHDCGSTDINPSYGKDVSLYIDTENLAEEITLSGDKDSLKNCFKLEGGDDIITNRIGERLIGNSNYIWTFSDDMYNEMSSSLRTKYQSYVSLVNSYQTRFNQLWNEKDQLVDDMLEWEHNKFPETNSRNYTPSEAWSMVTNKITYTSISSKYTTLDRLSSSILNYIKLVLPAGFGCKFQKKSDGSDNYGCTYINDKGTNVINTWWGYLYIYLKNCTGKNGEDLQYYNSGKWTLKVKKGYDSTPAGDVFSNDYFLYLKQQLDTALAKHGVSDVPKYDTDYPGGVSYIDDTDYYKNYFRQYSIRQLSSWADAYEKCTVIIYNIDNRITDSNNRNFYYTINSTGTKSSETIYNTLLKKYITFKNYIETIINEYQNYVDNDNKRLDVINKNLDNINAACNLENYLGKTLYNELLSFKREQVYSNSSFISDGLDDAKLMARIEEFIELAKEELAKACQLQYTINIKMGNLLSMAGYKDYYQYFALGNYIRAKYDNKLVKMRLSSVSFDFNSIENISVTFSDTQTGSSLSRDTSKILASAKSMTTSYNFVKHQSVSNNKKLDNFNNMFENGLDATKTLVMNSDNLSTLIDSQGILTRQYNYDTDSYDPCQLRITNGTIAITSDSWKNISAAFGKIVWKDQECYGIIAEKLIGQALIGNTFEINNQSGTYTINNNGFKISNNGNTISLNASNCSFAIKKQGENVLYFTPEEGLYVSGKIRGGSININDKFIVDEDGNVPATNGNFSGTVTDSTINIQNNFIIDETGHISATDGRIGNWTFYIDKYGNNYFEGNGESNWLRSSYNLTIQSNMQLMINSSSDIQISTPGNIYSQSTQNTHIGGQNIYISGNSGGAVYLNGNVYLNGELLATGNSGETGPGEDTDPPVPEVITDLKLDLSSILDGKANFTFTCTIPNDTSKHVLFLYYTEGDSMTKPEKYEIFHGKRSRYTITSSEFGKQKSFVLTGLKTNTLYYASAIVTRLVQNELISSNELSNIVTCIAIEH